MRRSAQCGHGCGVFAARHLANYVALPVDRSQFRDTPLASALTKFLYKNKKGHLGALMHRGIRYLAACVHQWTIVTMRAQLPWQGVHW